MNNPEFLRTLLIQERPLFGKVVAAVVESGLDHRPDPKSRSARELLSHIIGHGFDIAELAEDGVVHHRNQVPFASLAEALKLTDESFATAIDKLGATDAARWGEPAKFFLGERQLMEVPRQQMAWILFLDAIHHRGQLTTHLRAMGGKVPSLYGPSADDPGLSH